MNFRSGAIAIVWIVSCIGPQLAYAQGATVWAWNGPAPTHQPAAVEVSDGTYRCRAAYDNGKDTAALACFDKVKVPVWRHDRTQPRRENSSLVLHKDGLYVVAFAHASSGATVTAYDVAHGTVRWHRAVIGLGPVAHSEYLTGVQARVVDGVLRIYGWESAGRYIEDLDLRSGTLLANGPFDDKQQWRAAAVPPQSADDVKRLQPGAAKNVAYKFPGQGLQWNKANIATVTATAGPTTCTETLSSQGGRIVLTCQTDKGKSWGLQQARFVPGSALAINDQLVVVATFSVISSGATLDAYARTTGELLWHQQLYGLGPVAHSKYHNDLSLRFEGTNIVVSGAEAAGNYVEVLDAATGRITGNRRDGQIFGK